MKKYNQIVTAANSKTMNAVEKVRLFATAENMDPGHNFTWEADLPDTGQEKKASPNIHVRKNITDKKTGTVI